MTLGIGFGAGLLIKEVKTGKLHYKDVFGVLVLVGMLHSVIEDTFVVSFIGANIIITLFLRAVITLCLVYVLCAWELNSPSSFGISILPIQIYRNINQMVSMGL